MNRFISYIFSVFESKRLFCPVCKQDNITFLPLPDYYREMAKKYGYERYGSGEMISLDEYTCSGCGASDRERLYAYWINDLVAKDVFVKGTKLIHFAPESSLSKMISETGIFDYKTADYSMAGVDYTVDLMNLPFSDETYDLFICSHVLEHVDDDDAAIRELFRITKTGGVGILVAPISIGLNDTLEDKTITTEDERWRMFGQGDHLRLYAHDDYVNKIKSHGFSVKELGIDYFGKDVFRSLGMKDTSILYIVEKK